ncbi:MAG: nitrate reductase cytochrome c-type subunit [Ghiorsea sp.]|nr:nitrate reductase cytochrome c-type subunit [Ghiorsea sp.]
MNKVLMIALLFVSSTLLWAAENDVYSLRGDVALDAPSVQTTAKQWVDGEGKVNRNFNQQPPLIPHDIQDFDITREDNACMACHSMNAEMPGATKVGVSHFLNRDNEALLNISPRRYFCTQCHVPQTNAKPLISNDFRSLMDE